MRDTKAAMEVFIRIKFIKSGDYTMDRRKIQLCFSRCLSESELESLSLFVRNNTACNKKQDYHQKGYWKEERRRFPSLDINT